MTATTLAHFSDPHLAFEPQLSWRQRFSKRQLSALSWHRGRRESQQNDLLDTLVADLRATRPEHIVISGDIGNFSLPGEFPAAARWLETLGASADVSVVPGNHDALVTVDDHAGLGRWAPWMSDDDGTQQWPYVRIRGDVALIGVNSALPTLPLLATGRIGPAQRERLEARLQELGARGLCRVLVLHHPPAAGAVSRRKALTDAAELRALLERAGVELVLHGHARDARFDLLRGPAGSIASLGLPSASAAPSGKDQGSRWHRLQFSADGSGDWELEIGVRIWHASARGFASAGTFCLRLPRQVLPAATVA